MWLHGLVVSSGAFLLFLVQPMLGKFLLPRFGGGAAVWTGCLVFFQAGLFGGYLYAHLLGRLGLRRQIGVHAVFAGVALLGFGRMEGVLARELEPGGTPFWGIQEVLAAGIGLPYHVLGASAPLVQRWLERARPGRPAYRLYALSNLGSFAALFAYPVLIEPHLTRGEQSTLFQLGLYGFCGLLLICGAVTWRAGESAEEPERVAPGEAAVPLRDRLAWWGLPLCSAAWLVTITQAVSENVPPMPFLWVLFLALYLLSYVFAFQGQAWVSGRGVQLLVVGAAALVARVHYREQTDHGYLVTLVEYGLLFFVSCCFLHGELYRRRPARAGDSSFYLALSGGGMLGGLAVALLAPALATTWIELPLLVLLVVGLSLFELCRSLGHRVVKASGLLLWCGFAVSLTLQELELREGALVRARNPYGVHAVYELDVGDPLRHRYELTSGTTAHGWQYQLEPYRREPTAYFTRQGGAGRAFRSFPADRPLNVGIVGLGAGVLATYGNRGDRIRFYEIDPKVIEVARETFTFLADSQAEVELVEGDARVVLEGEPSRGFDLLVLDAFSSDAIPVHLLTRECFELYLRHLAPRGRIAVHVSSRYLDLVRVLATTARELELAGIWMSLPARELAALPSTWVILCRDPALLESEAFLGVGEPLESVRRPARPWTDEHQSLLEVLAWDGR